MITFRYINKNRQPSYTSYTLLVESDGVEFEGVIRIEKTFKVDTRQIDDEFLRAEAMLEIERIKYELENPMEIPPQDLHIELPPEE